MDNLLDGECGFFGTESLNDVKDDLWNNSKFETDYSRPVTSLTDKAENTIELIPKVKERPPEPEEITFSEELSKLFPEANEKMTEQEEKINDLPLRDLEKIFSKIDQGEIPQELKFFAGGRNDEFKNRVRSLEISTSSSEFLDFLQSEGITAALGIRSTHMITLEKNLKFKIQSEEYKENIVIQLEKITKEETIKLKDDKVTNFSILATREKKKVGKKMSMSYEIIDQVKIGGL